jgi:hypothetical protein
MPISWNEIRHNAIRFSRDWAGVISESAEKQTFWNEFFQVFGIKRRVVASFEESVKKISGDYGRIDLFWPGILLVEHKSFGEDLHKAETQAFQYIRELAAELDRAVEKCYRPEPFHSDRERVEFLFSLYEKLTAPLLPATPQAKTRRSSSSTLPAKPRKQRTPGLPANPSN